jgi:hypothetical protein
MICCFQPGLTEALYILYIYEFLRNSNCTYFNLWTIDNRLTKTMTNDRLDPSLEGAPDWQTSNCQTATNIWSWAPAGARHQDWLTGWPSVVKWLWLWLWLRVPTCARSSTLKTEAACLSEPTHIVRFIGYLHFSSYKNCLCCNDSWCLWCSDNTLGL